MTTLNLNFETSRGKFRLNPFLVEQQKLTQEQVNEIIALHARKDAVFDTLEMINDPGLLEMVTDLEFQSQDAWGFPRDANWHRFFEIPRCRCPRLDNIDALGTSWKSVSSACPHHGTRIEVAQYHAN